MKKKLLSICLVAMASMLTQACGANSSVVSASSSSSTSTAPSSSASTAPSSSSSTGKSSTSTSTSLSSSEPVSSSSSSSLEEVIEADPSYPSTLPEGSVVRDYNADFDEMVDDFSGDTAKGTLAGSAIYNSKPYLSVRLNSSNEVFPNSEDACIYKQGEGTYPIKDYDGIGIRMKLHAGSKAIANDKLVLALRGDDGCQTYPIKLSAAIDPDGTNMPALTGEYQDFIVSPNQTIEDENTVYKLKDGTDSTIKVLQQIIGIHLYAQGKMDATIDLESVYLVKGANKTVIEDFEHAKPNDGGANLWWRDSTGTIISRNTTIKEGGSYAVTTDKSKENLVLNIQGDSATTEVEFSDGTNTVKKAWADLKDSEGNAIPAVLKKTYAPIVISLADSGVTLTPTSYKVISTSEVTINKIYLTDLVTEKKEAYPSIDVADYKSFDSFTRTQTGFNGDYDASHANQLIIDAGLDYALSYNSATASMVSIDGNDCVFDASTLPAEGYINFKEGSDAHARTNEKYMVFSMKMTDGATLDNFRFKGNGSDAYYANNWLASNGTKSVDTPYTTEAGYSLYVIDLTKSAMDVTNTVDMYYSGAGKLAIDEIFFTDDYQRELVSKGTDVNKDLNNKVVDTSAYAYVGAIECTGVDVVGLTFKGDGTSTLGSLRFEMNGTTNYIKDGLIKDQKGHVLSKDTVLPEENTTIYIDLVKSGLTVGTGDTAYMHIHAGGVDGSTGSITFASADTYAYENSSIERIETPATDDLANYAYVGWVGNQSAMASAGHKYIYLTVKGDGTATLDSFRLADGAEFWVKDSKIVLKDGTVLVPGTVVPTEDTTYIIDIEATGLDVTKDIHAHIGGGYTGTLIISSMKLVLDSGAYSAIVSAYYAA